MHVAARSGSPLAGLFVEAWTKSDRGDLRRAASTTDAAGKCQLHFETVDGGEQLRLFFVIRDRAHGVMWSSELYRDLEPGVRAFAFRIDAAAALPAALPANVALWGEIANRRRNQRLHVECLHAREARDELLFATSPDSDGLFEHAVYAPVDVYFVVRDQRARRVLVSESFELAPKRVYFACLDVGAGRASLLDVEPSSTSVDWSSRIARADRAKLPPVLRSLESVLAIEGVKRAPPLSFDRR